MKRSLTILTAFSVCLVPLGVWAGFSVQQIADEGLINQQPVISETGLVAWQALAGDNANNPNSDIYTHKDGNTKSLTKGTKTITGNSHPQVYRDRVVWVGLSSPEIAVAGTSLKDVKETDAQETDGLDAEPLDTNQTEQAIGTLAPQRKNSGSEEIVLWDGNEISMITSDGREDLGPTLSDDLIVWQKGRDWPLGWEIMVWENSEFIQLTTNYFYDMAPKIYGKKVVWYGWDGEDFEIFLYDHEQKTTTQITSNKFDDVAPVISENFIAWEGYPSVEGDIFVWQDGTIKKLSDNPEDDSKPCVWKNYVVWQGFDGDDFEMHLFDGEKVVQLTNNNYDDVNPSIGDGIITWMGYHNNWDPEIFAMFGIDGVAEMLTNNDYEDREPQTAGGKVVWRARNEGKTLIFLATPEE